jgi:5-(carboxyamino)imidazole ribonucleotide mutase
MSGSRAAAGLGPDGGRAPSDGAEQVQGGSREATGSGHDGGRAPSGGAWQAQTATVGVIMGSDSDWPTMKAAAEALAEFEVPYEVRVVSAHRTPVGMIEYAQSAASRGLRVIIAGAGGAAHLPGMVASVTPLPVIGVPVPLKHLDGMDSLLSIVQMPAGIPVATVSIGGARNAGLLAVRILAASDEALRARVVAFQEALVEVVAQKDANLRASL